MRYVVCLLLFLMVFACVPTQQVVDVDTNVGYYSFAGDVQKILENKKAAGEADPKMTPNEVLTLITLIKKKIESEGATVIGVESGKNLIWFAKPVE